MCIPNFILNIFQKEKKSRILKTILKVVLFLKALAGSKSYQSRLTPVAVTERGERAGVRCCHLNME